MIPDLIRVTPAVLDHDEAVAHVTHASAGGKKVVHLEYEGYIPMADKELKSICDAIRRQWPGVVGIAMLHRLGVVAVKEASVIIAVSSPHRRESLEAVAYAIDTLKARVPIWKLEKYEGDERMWKENAEWRTMTPIDK
ncbi:Aste57867_21162 [Aphanomyces stellatus]|uniref:Aste57867_21162 protein n=1 Tax=Aphanomyces stellatus TaxID=120398 RepID=A0A485LGT9_9STRA|nr:hypothetical protein As57867_021094 [Aphanomyces stellatus]VFT97836.1 Aste57867_21162 [Aphanomyces stellatus]